MINLNLIWEKQKYILKVIVEWNVHKWFHENVLKDAEYHWIKY